MSSDQIITIDPATGSEIARYDCMSADDIDAVLGQSAAAQKSWAATPITDRAAVILKAAQILRDRSAELGAIATAEMGKPITEAVAEVAKCAWVCEYYADMSPKVLADEDVQAAGSRSWVRYEPLGTILAIMPWNYPFWQVFRFVAPTLMAGNAGILKHSPNVTGTALAIEQVLLDAGLPEGVFRSLVVGEADVPTTVNRLIQDDRIAAVTLTGSNLAGSHVAASAGRAAKKSLLELGGSDPFVVLADADLDVVVPKAVAGRFLNTGQSCLCAKRFIVHESIADEFGRRFAAAVDDLVIGAPSDPATKIGPLARVDLAENLEHQVAASVAAGAVVLTGGKRLDRGPAWYAPTVLVNVKPDMPVMAEETFGPAAAVIAFGTDDEAVALANATPYGLGASVWSADADRALALGSRIDSGALFINAVTASDPRLPFGGVKQSGYGRELGEAGAREFTNIRTVLVG
ncbi:NAD-dependent succinate-semialdehyde dehydrogenase [Nocardioides sp. LS1]|uniref:NAD-dependent succinate-semialdehyde dehydrogenase n=1 Tax=Nocardioides sp. LS1 TaxID=1027620 RepID=UPI000F61967C|nr:NAD-dependent succinate-semialdehyde dehydrogenase [Nocardioides sp. LS1]GCD88200.1 succinate-semialdehyde dehydrogenase [Nocardioides sp. LS1]